MIPAIAEACGWEQTNFCKGFIWVSLNGRMVERPLLDLNTLYEIEKALGLHDRDNLGKRIEWISALREVVSTRCSACSDVDIVTASKEERLYAILKLIT